MPASHPRLELVWPGKDQFLLTPTGEEGKPIWVEPDHPAAHEVRLTEFTDACGHVNEADPYADNLVFTGDSLDVLRVLCEVPEYRQHYRGRVKLIYCDSPFNTQRTFDHYDDWMEHSTWLSFMRDRLLLMKELLSPEGSIWVHLDDVEVHRMRCVLDEVFGAQNCVATLVWQKADSTRNDAKAFSADHDYMLVYRGGPNWRVNRLPRTAESDARFSSPDGDSVPWFDDNPTAPGARTHQGMVYAIQHPISGKLIYPARGRCWWTEQTRLLDAMNEYTDYELRDIGDSEARAEICGVEPEEVRPNVKAIMLTLPGEEAADQARRRYEAGSWPQIVLRSGGEGGLGRKSYVPSAGLVPGTLWSNDDVGHNRQAKAEIKALFPGVSLFDTPKPERLIQRVLHVGSSAGDIVLDPFAGSGTTAAVAHKMSRRWVTAEISPETVRKFIVPRLRKVVEGADPGGITKDVGWEGGGGFRTVTVGPSMYEVTPFGVMLADWATNGKFARAVAGQLGFTFQPDAAPLCGVRGRMRLAVLDGAVGPEEVREIVAVLGDSERVTVVAKVILPGAAEALAEVSRGSKIRKAPRDLLADDIRRSRRRRTARSGGDQR